MRFARTVNFEKDTFAKHNNFLITLMPFAEHLAHRSIIELKAFIVHMLADCVLFNALAA